MSRINRNLKVDTHLAIESLVKLGEKLGYRVQTEISLSKITDHPELTRHKIDVGFFQNGELVVAIEIESAGFSKIPMARDEFKMNFIRTRFWILSAFIARNLTKEQFNFLLSQPQRVFRINKRNQRRFFGMHILYQITKFIEDNPNTHLREISQSLKIHPETVRRMLVELSDYIEVQPIIEQTEYFPKLPVLIRLKKEYTADGIVRTLQTLRKINKE